MPNLQGSFGAGQIDTSAVREAIARRQQGGPAPQLGQTSQQPAQTPPLPSPQGQASPQSGPPALSPPESELIVKALSQRLGSISSLEKSKLAPQGGRGGGGDLQSFVSHKIPILRHEGYKPSQAAAIAYSMGRKRT